MPVFSMELTHFEYTFGLYTSNLGEAVRTVQNPFTGKPVSIPIDRGLTEQEINAVKAVFDRNGLQGPEPEFEGYAIYGTGGDSLRFRGGDFDCGIAVIGFSVEIVVRHLMEAMLEIVLDAARAGNFALMSCVGDCVRVSSPASVTCVPVRYK